MPFIIHKETKGERFFKLKVRLAVTKDGRAVAPTDTAAVRMLGGIGSLVSEADAKKYQLDASQIESSEDVYVPPPAPEPAAEPAPEPEAPSDELPEDFPGRKALNDAGITTLAQVRALENVKDIPGIGEAKAAQIAEWLAQ